MQNKTPKVQKGKAIRSSSYLTKVYNYACDQKL